MKQRPHGRQADRETGPPGTEPTSPADTWQDWVTIWQSELNALATDREAQQLWARLVNLWAAQARAAGAFLPAGGAAPFGHDGAARRAGAEPPAGAKAAPAAPDAGDAERQRLAVERLAQRVEELERRLAALGGGKG